MNTVMVDLCEQKRAVAVVGLGYVGLPLACLLATKYKVFGVDINQQRIYELQDGIDRTLEVIDRNELVQPNLHFTFDASCLRECSVIIVAVPTPIDAYKKPDLQPLISASEMVGRYMSKGSVVVYESTVYPGLTEDVCRRHLEKTSGMTFGKDFELGYSPERVVPGDRERTIRKVMKIVSGSTPETLDLVDHLYGSVVEAGTHRAPSIATAEAAKIIENAQRDINIALINELACIFERIGLDTLDVIAAAGTKWNFLPFKPGLVGGHCIGVDPYYLTYLAESLNIHPQVIASGRKINDDMGRFVGEKMIKMVLSSGVPNNQPLSIAVCGMTFKENVPDLRNTKVIDLVQTLEEFGARVYCLDPVCDPKEFEEEFGRTLTKWEDLPPCQGLVLAVPHQQYKDTLQLVDVAEKLTGPRVFIDLKGVYGRDQATDFGLRSWRL